MTDDSTQKPALTEAEALANQKRNKRMLIAIFAIAFVPFFGTWLLVPMVRDAGVWGTTNNGELLWPPAELKQWNLQHEGGESLKRGEAKWRLVVISHASCSAACEQAILNVRQLQVLLGKDANRVRRIAAVGTEGRNQNDFAGWRDALLAQYPKLSVASFDAQALPITDSVENAAGAEAAAGPRDGVYLVDTHGNVILFYSYEQAHKPLLHDIKKLLRNSRIG